MEKTKAMCSFGTDEYVLQTGNVKISDLYDFKGHPFKVEQDIQLFELMRSIEDKGVLVPLLVRSNPYGDGYEIIAGHRRKAACIWAGIEKVPVIIREMSDFNAVIAMIDSNLQREYIKPSEKAYAYACYGWYCSNKDDSCYGEDRCKNNSDHCNDCKCI